MALHDLIPFPVVAVNASCPHIIEHVRSVLIVTTEWAALTVSIRDAVNPVEKGGPLIVSSADDKCPKFASWVRRVQKSISPPVYRYTLRSPEIYQPLRVK